MPDNEIIDEIRRHRDEVARRCDYDVDKLFAYYREQQARRAREGWNIVSFAGEREEAKMPIIREESPKPDTSGPT